MRNNARRIWASTPQNCATTNRTAFGKHMSFKVCLFVVRRFIACLRKSYYIYISFAIRVENRYNIYRETRNSSDGY